MLIIITSILIMQSCEMSGIWEIYLCKNFGDLG